MSDIQWNDIPSDDSTPKVATTTDTAGVEWQDVPTSNAQQVQPIIDTAPLPGKVQEIVNQAIAIQGITKMPWEDAFQKAQVLTTTTDPKPKRFGQAIIDRWKIEKLNTQIGQTGNNARKAFQRGDEAEYTRFLKEYDDLTAQLPALGDVANAPGGVFGKVGYFLKSMVVGGTGLVSQQLEMIAGKQQQEKLSALQTEARQAPLLSLKSLTAPWIAMAEQGKQQVAGIGEIEAGSAFMDLVKAGVDPGIADRFAKGIGAINNAIEFAQVATFVKIFPGAGAIIEKASSTLVRKLLLGPALKNTALRLTMELAKGTTEQMAQEIAQEAVTFYGENWATEIQNATKGTALEGNKDFLARVDSLVKDFLPGVLALGAIPIGLRAIGIGEKAQVKAAPKPAEPTPMEMVRSDVAKAIEAGTPAVAKDVITIAETAKAQEIVEAPVLTPTLVNDAVELADMQAAVKDRAEIGTLPSEKITGGVPIVEGRVDEEVDPGTHSFRQWFGESKVVDADSNPLVVYHGTDTKIDVFRADISKRNVTGGETSSGNAFWFTDNKYIGTKYANGGISATGEAVLSGKNLVEVYLSIQNPLIVDMNELSLTKQEKDYTVTAGRDVRDKDKKRITEIGFRKEMYVRKAIAEGYDGVIFKNGYDGPAYAGDIIAVFSSSQIKMKGTPSTIESRSGNAKASIESGAWVPDATLGQFSVEPWAQDELTSRNDLREEASYEADTGQAPDFETFLANIKGMEPTPRSDEYYRNIWDTSAKADVAIDEETQTPSVEAQIDSTIAAEGVAVSKEDALSAEVDRFGVDAADRTVKNILENEQQSVDLGYQMDPQIQKLNAEIEDLQKSVADLKTKNETIGSVKQQKKLDEAISQRDKAKTKLASVNQKALIKKMTRSILRQPSGGIGQEAIQKIRDLQVSYTAKETTGLNKAKKAIMAWQTAHPGAPLIKEAQDILSRRSIKDLSVAELVDLYKRSRDIRKEGAAKTKAAREVIKANRIDMTTRLLNDIPGGVTAKRLAEFASESTKRKEKRLARKGFVTSNIKHPIRFFQAMGPSFKKFFWDDRKAWEGREADRETEKTRAIAELFQKTGTTATEMLRRLPGTEYYIDDLMTYYGQMKDPDGRKAVIWGNDEDEMKITRLIGEMPQKYKDFVDGVIDLNNKGYGEVEAVQIANNGIAAPKVDNYLPIRREGDFGKPFSEELSTDAGIRESAHMASMSKGFTNPRKIFKDGMAQSRIRTDFLNILTEQISKESKYVAGESWARDMGWLLSGKAKESKQFLEATKQKWGQPYVTMMKDYANAVVNPESFNGQHFNGLISRIFRNFNDAQLMYKLSTAVIQVEGPFRTLSQLDLKQWHYLAAGLWKASTQPNKTAEMVYQKSPVMRAMAEGQAIDPALREGRGLKHSRTEIGLQLQKFHKGMRTGGYWMLTQMNKWTVISEWTSKYYAELAKTGEETTAIQAADDAVYMNQPSGNLADAPRMYWASKGNIILAFLQRFSRANNQTAQMMTFDLWRDLKTGHPAKALGVVLAFAIGAYINSVRMNKRPPKDAEEYLKAGIAGGADALGAMTFGAGQALVAGVTGGFSGGEIKPLEPFKAAGAIAKDVLYGNVSEKEVMRLISTIMQATGMPYGGGENVVRSAYDFETGEFRFDPIELFGRRPRE